MQNLAEDTIENRSSDPWTVIKCDKKRSKGAVISYPISPE